VAQASSRRGFAGSTAEGSGHTAANRRRKRASADAWSSMRWQRIHGRRLGAANAASGACVIVLTSVLAVLGALAVSTWSSRRTGCHSAAAELTFFGLGRPASNLPRVARSSASLSSIYSYRFRPFKGWQRLTEPCSWDFLLGSSPFSYADGVETARRKGYTDNLMWVDGMPDGDVDAYPAAFTSYLSRLLLSRDPRCAAWWAGASEAGSEAPELLFARFEASVAASLTRSWVGNAGPLAVALMKRFGGRFPFDAAPQVRLCFSTLPEAMLRDSFFDQAFSSDRDELMEVFLVIDADGDGVLSGTDIRTSFGKVGSALSNAEVQQMVEDALANSDGEVDFAGFKEAVYSSLKAARRRADRGLPDEEWWRDPAALVPADSLDAATPELIQEACRRWQALVRRKLESPGEGDDDAATLATAAAPAAVNDTSVPDQLPLVPPLMRERPLSLSTYALFTVAGALACTLTHAFLVPIDVVKTLQQSQPERFRGLGMGEAAAMLWRQGGPRELFLGTVPTMIGYSWYGATVFPGYEFFKRKLVELCGPRLGAKLRVPLVLLSGAIATFFACIGVCPAEAVRIRTVTSHGFQRSFLLPVSSLFAGFAPLLFRQVLFGMAKFLVFDTFAAAVYRRFPQLARRKSTAALVSLLSGATAGLIATLVSQPSDTILTKLVTSPHLGIVGAAEALWSVGRFGAFFSGVSTRAVWAAAIIAGQFLLYDVAKQFFCVTATDLTQTADPVMTAVRTPDRQSPRSKILDACA